MPNNRGCRNPHDRDQRQVQRSPGSNRRIPQSGAPLRLRAASRPHRSRYGVRRGLSASSAAMGVLLQQAHFGDSAYRVSLTPEPESATVLWKSRSRRSCCRPWACARSCRWSPHAPAAGAQPQRHSRKLPASDIQGFILWVDAGLEGALSGASRISNVAVMGCIVNGPGRANTPISAFHCRARVNSRRLPCSSMARRPRPCAGRRHRGFQADGDRLHRAPLRHRRAGRGIKKSHARLTRPSYRTIFQAP